MSKVQSPESRTLCGAPPGSEDRGMKLGVTVDTVIFTIRDRQLQALLVKRAGPPFKGRWAIPGGFVRSDESLDQAALRELREATGVADVYLEQLYTFGDPGRDPRGRVITISYFALIASEAATLRSGPDAAAASGSVPCGSDMQSALGLVERGPAAGARVLARRGAPGAGPAADRAETVLEERVDRDVVAFDVRLLVGLGPFGDRGDLDLAAGDVEVDDARVDEQTKRDQNAGDQEIVKMAMGVR